MDPTMNHVPTLYRYSYRFCFHALIVTYCRSNWEVANQKILGVVSRKKHRCVVLGFESHLNFAIFF